MTVLEFADSIHVDADPATVYDLVSDVTRIGEWSPICKACWWDDADDTGVGAWFTGRNETPDRTWETRSQVVAADPGREFTWEVNNGWVRWGFVVEPDGAGTRLTENWHFLPTGIAGFGERFGDRAETEIRIRSDAALSGIPVTLAAIKATAEAS